MIIYYWRNRIVAIAPVLKTGTQQWVRGFESHFLRHALVVPRIEHRFSKPRIEVRFLSRAPKQNSTAFSKPEGGTREARPTDFPPFFQTNSAFLARWGALIFRRGGGSSQRFLWHRPFLQKCLNQKQFCLYSVRLLTSFGKVRANHFACVKDCRFLLRATSS